jgi:hypothetical protein
MLKDDMRDMDILYWKLRDEYINGPRPSTGKLLFELTYTGPDNSLVAQIGVPNATNTGIDTTRDSTMYQKIEIPQGNWNDIWTKRLKVDSWPEPEYWKISGDAEGTRESVGYTPEACFPYPHAIVRRFGEYEWRLLSDHNSFVVLSKDNGVIQVHRNNQSETVPIGDEEVENAEQSLRNIVTLEMNLRNNHLLGWDVYYFPADYRPEGSVDMVMLCRKGSGESGVESLIPRASYVSIAMARTRSLAWQMYSILAEEVVLRAR